MKVIVYTDLGAKWHAEMVLNPSWSEIETAIRRTDKFYFPSVSLYYDKDQTDDIPNFDVTGGKGDWAMYACTDTDYRSFYNPSGNPDPDELVWIWQSDQGAHAPDTNVCHSIDVVLSTVRYFFETGTLDPSVKWEEI